MPGKEGVKARQGENGLAFQAKKHNLLRLCGGKVPYAFANSKEMWLHSTESEESVCKMEFEQ